jgi:NADH-quinone oxidoreductase subunit L
MSSLVWLVPAIPLMAFLLLMSFGRKIGKRGVGLVGAGPLGLSMIIAVVTAVVFICRPPVSGFYSSELWTWFTVNGLTINCGLYVDYLSIVMMLVVTVVGFLIFLYSIAFMAGDDGYSRFFAYMNLFVGAMLILVLADNLLFLYLGWEGVGLCSYLLIGFWRRDEANGRAAMKAFVVTRVGDTSLAIALFAIAVGLGTLGIAEVLQKAVAVWPVGSFGVTIVAALLLGGAVGKSAQLPLQTWLPDAMAGPTPVSALIHAATMVSAGVYLLARMRGLFALAPVVQLTVALVGVTTLLVAASSALCQRDLKRILAYSTMSQVGYMFLALGVGAWGAAIFHFMTHAFFKALLFLSAGVVIQALDNEHDVFRMGGMRKTAPVAFWTFLVGACSLSALPFVTAGFYSKDLILSQVFQFQKGGAWLYFGGLVGAGLTSLYIFRAVFLVFFGGSRKAPVKRVGTLLNAPLIVLALFSIGSGFFWWPGVTGAVNSYSWILSAAITILGIATAALVWGRRYSLNGRLSQGGIDRGVKGFFFAGWGFDRLYDLLLVRPFARTCQAVRSDWLDLPFRGIAKTVAMGYEAFSAAQNGLIRWYVAVLAAGVAIFIGIAVFS